MCQISFNRKMQQNKHKQHENFIIDGYGGGQISLTEGNISLTLGSTNVQKEKQ